MKDELMIKCLENSLWAQYVIEFFKFVGFSVLKETYGDLAKNIDTVLGSEQNNLLSTEKKGVFEKEDNVDESKQKLFEILFDGFESNQINLLIEYINDVNNINKREKTTENEIVLQQAVATTIQRDDDSITVVTIASDLLNKNDIIKNDTVMKVGNEPVEKMPKKQDVITTTDIKSDSDICVIRIIVDENELSNNVIRRFIMSSILKVIAKKTEERKSLTYLFSKYERYDLFHHLYNEGLLKYPEDYYNSSGKSNGFKQDIKEACKLSKRCFAQCYNELTSEIENESIEESIPNKDDKYLRYVVLFLKYKLNDLKYSIEKKYIFSPAKMLEEIDNLTETNHHFMRAFYLAARICRSDPQANIGFNYYIDRALNATDDGQYSNKTKSYLYYQLAKFYEERNYSIYRIKEAYEKAVLYDQNNCFSLYKQAEYLYRSGGKSEIYDAVKILEKMEDVLVDHFDYAKLIPKRRIHGYRCCAFLGNIRFNQHEYEEAEKYYTKAIALAITGSTYFRGDKDKHWEKVFYMCMPLTPITRNMMRIYGSEPEKNDEAEKLYIKFYKENLEQELRNYWKK